MGDSKNPEVWKAVAMADHFEKIQRLPDKLEGAPNFRRVPGYKVGDRVYTERGILSVARF